MVKEVDSRRAPREGGRSRGQEGGGSFWLCKSGGGLGVGVGPGTGCGGRSVSIQAKILSKSQ